MKILIAGDFCPRFRIDGFVENGDYAAILQDIKLVTAQADYSLVNFECPVVKHPAHPIVKQGPNLKCSQKGLEAIKWAGFNCVTLANNHFLDYGEVGVSDTLESCNSLGLDYVGGGMDIREASKTLYKVINGQCLAIINCCEHEFSIATEKSAGCNPLDPISQYYDIIEARKKADKVIVIVHGGHEHFQLPSVRMMETYRFFIDVGADAVINHHQHCFSGYEIYKGKTIFYGLGNFCFDHNKNHSDKWVEGYAVILDLSDKASCYELYPYKQCGAEIGVRLLERGAFDAKLRSLNDIIADRHKLEKSLTDYYEKCKKGVSAVLSPIGGHYLSGAISRGWISPLITLKKKLKIENLTCCESHRDKLQYFLNSRIK